MRQNERIKVCYVLPETAEDTATHFAHKWELIKELEDRVEFFVCQPTLWGIIKIKLVYMFRGCRIFYVHYSFKGALVALLLTKLFGGRVFYWNCGMPWLYKRGWFEERLFRFILRHTILVIGTKGLADEYAKRYGLDKKNIRVMPNYLRVSRMQGIAREAARNELGLPQNKKIVLFLHRLSRRKGAHLLPEIIKEFDEREDVLFLVVGDGQEKENIKFQVSCLAGRQASFKFQDAIRFEGSIPNDKIPYYFAASDVYLMPSEEEGMPNALLEAMAVGVPFVASDVGAVREMAPPIAGEFILLHGDTRLYAEKIKKLLTDEELRKRISAEEQEWVKRYDVSAIAPKFLELFQL